MSDHITFRKLRWGKQTTSSSSSKMSSLLIFECNFQLVLSLDVSRRTLFISTRTLRILIFFFFYIYSMYRLTITRHTYAKAWRSLIFLAIFSLLSEIVCSRYSGRSIYLVGVLIHLPRAGLYRKCIDEYIFNVVAVYLTMQYKNLVVLYWWFTLQLSFTII